MKDNMRHLKHVIKLAETKEATPAAASGSIGNTAGAVGSPTNLVQKLQAKLKVLEGKLKEAEDKYIENFENDSSSLEQESENEGDSDDTESIPENVGAPVGFEKNKTVNESNNMSDIAGADLGWNLHRNNDSTALGTEYDLHPRLNEEVASVKRPPALLSDKERDVGLRKGSHQDQGKRPQNDSVNIQKNAPMASKSYTNGGTSDGVTLPSESPVSTAVVPTKPPVEAEHVANKPQKESKPVITSASLSDLTPKNASLGNESKPVLSSTPLPDLTSKNPSLRNESKPVQKNPLLTGSTTKNVTVNDDNVSSVNASEEVLGEDPDRDKNNVDHFYNTSARSGSRNQAGNSERFLLKEPDYEAHPQKDFRNAFKSSNSSEQSSHWSSPNMSNSTIRNSSKSVDDFAQKPTADSWRIGRKAKGRSESDLNDYSDDVDGIPAEVDRRFDSARSRPDNDTYPEDSHVRNSSVSVNSLDLGNSSFPEERNQSHRALWNESYPENSKYLERSNNTNSLPSDALDLENNTYAGLRHIDGLNARDSDFQNDRDHDEHLDANRLDSLDRDNRSYSDSVRNHLNDSSSTLSDEDDKTFSQRTLGNDSISSHERNKTDPNELKDDSAVSPVSHHQDHHAFRETVHEDRTSPSDLERENRTSYDHFRGDSTLSRKSGNDESKRTDSSGNATAVDSDLGKSNRSSRGYYYGGMSNIDDGLRNSSSSKDEYMSAERAWRQRLVARHYHKSNGTIPVKSDAPSNASEVQAQDSQTYSIDNDKKSDDDDDRLSDGARDPDTVSEIDGNDLFGDRSMENAGETADIDDGIIDTPTRRDDEKRNRVVPRYPVTWECPEWFVSYIWRTNRNKLGQSQSALRDEAQCAFSQRRQFWFEGEISTNLPFARCAI